MLGVGSACNKISFNIRLKKQMTLTILMFGSSAQVSKTRILMRKGLLLLLQSTLKGWFLNTVVKFKFKQHSNP